MHDNFDGLLKDVDLNLVLPSYVFSKRFDKHLFFDSDIRTSDTLIPAFKDITSACFGPDLSFLVVAYPSRSLVGYVGSEDNWTDKLRSYSDQLYKLGDYGGVVLVDVLERWAVFQASPVSVGVLSFNCVCDNVNLTTIIEDNFFDKNNILCWLTGSTPRDISIVKLWGRDYLIELLANYS